MKQRAINAGSVLRQTALALYLIAVIVTAASCASKQSLPKNTENQTSASQPAAMLIATPNPVPAGKEAGTTKVAWKTGNGASGQVFVSENGSPEQLFAEGVEGSQDAPWISTGTTYEFRLYEGKDHAKQLASVKVMRAEKK